MARFEAYIEGMVHTLQTDVDLNNVECYVAHPELSCIRTDTGRQQLRSLLNRYREAGSPPLEVVNHRAEMIRNMIDLEVFLGISRFEPRFDTPGSGVPWRR